jgi:hypothetical protein
MHRRLPTIALLITTALIAGACGASTTTPSPASSQAGEPSASTVAEASPIAAASESAVASPSASAAATPEPTATPSPTPAPTPVPWKKFTSTRYKYSVKYPPDWVVTKGSAKLADQIDDYSTHFVFLSRDTVSGIASINLTATHDKAYMKSHYKAKLLTDKRLTVNGWPGRLMTFAGSDGGRKLYIQHLILAKGKVGYIVEMFSDRGTESKDKALFKKIYKTFKPKS